MSSLLTKTLDDVRKESSGPDRRSSSSSARAAPYSKDRGGAGGSWKHDLYATNQGEPRVYKAGSGPRFARDGDAPAEDRRSKKLAISNLHYEVSERELETLFIQIGPLASPPKILFDRSGRSKGIAFVAYEMEEHARKARDNFDGAMAKGQPITVEYDFRRDPPAPGSLLARVDNDRPRRGPGPLPPRGRGAGGAPRGSTRGGRGGGPRGGRVPKTSDDLDKELEAFMQQPAAAKEDTGDVEMS